ncbi:SDR family oxidoreductase [Paraburkholderia sp. SUR17]|uniref:UDP-glucose 4-epimerase family protein n=1 Tax=Paraburkholderia sp. SUR17 TaxID=3034358 RepID=UPI00240831A0|nr:SDR family oxidoreductase [Paraburkholderia sp. SUR17]WEY39439.1 SDR family oxidoreductase [Paraburkholderia sp. SUR17]
MTQHIAITGANGFVGKALSRVLLERGDVVTGIVRHPQSTYSGVREWVFGADDFDGIEDAWPSTLHCDVVVHLAARVHVMKEAVSEPLAAYRATNVTGSLRVARAARRAGVRRLVFVSSIKAVAESSQDHPVTETDRPMPTDPYGISKLEAERALLEFGAQSGMEIVIVRPPLVYGPGVRANFLQLMRAIAKGVPLPLGAVTARRSMVFVDNLADALVHCIVAPDAAGQTFHVTDGQDLTVAELVEALARQLHVPTRLIPVPVPLLRLAGRLTGRSAAIDRLVGDLRVDSAHIREVLGWSAPYTVEQGLLETASWYDSTR